MRDSERATRRERARANARAALARAMRPQAVARPVRPEKRPLRVPPPPCRPAAGQIVRHGQPCARLGDAFRELLEEDGWSAGRVVNSSKVPQSVFDARMTACRTCPHSTEFANGKLVCACCTCPRWQPFGYDESTDLWKRNWYEKNVCPTEEPAFWLYEPAGVGAALT